MIKVAWLTLAIWDDGRAALHFSSGVNNNGTMLLVNANSGHRRTTSLTTWLRVLYTDSSTCILTDWLVHCSHLSNRFWFLRWVYLRTMQRWCHFVLRAVVGFPIQTPVILNTVGAVRQSPIVVIGLPFWQLWRHDTCWFNTITLSEISQMCCLYCDFEHIWLKFYYKLASRSSMYLNYSRYVLLAKV